MYYKEKLINGKYYYKTHPKEAWHLMNYDQLTTKVTKLITELVTINIKYNKITQFDYATGICKVEMIIIG